MVHNRGSSIEGCRKSLDDHQVILIRCRLTGQKALTMPSNSGIMIYHPATWSQSSYRNLRRCDPTPVGCLLIHYYWVCVCKLCVMSLSANRIPNANDVAYLTAVVVISAHCIEPAVWHSCEHHTIKEFHFEKTVVWKMYLLFQFDGQSYISIERV